MVLGDAISGQLQCRSQLGRDGVECCVEFCSRHSHVIESNPIEAFREIQQRFVTACLNVGEDLSNCSTRSLAIDLRSGNLITKVGDSAEVET